MPLTLTTEDPQLPRTSAKGLFDGSFGSVARFVDEARSAGVPDDANVWISDHRHDGTQGGRELVAVYIAPPPDAT